MDRIILTLLVLSLLFLIDVSALKFSGGKRMQRDLESSDLNRELKWLFGLIKRPVSIAALILLVVNVFLALSLFGVDISLADGRVVPLQSSIDINTSIDIADSEIIDESDSQYDSLIERLDFEIETNQQHPSPELALEEPESEWRTIRMRVTGYCPCSKCCGKHSDGRTANMHHIQWGDRFVAADKKFAFGTEMIVPGYNGGNVVEVKDRGRVIKGNRLDVFFNTHYSAQKWGTKYLDVKVRRR